MAQKKVTWGDARSYFERHGYEFHWKGGDVLITPPKTNSAERRSRAPVAVGHVFTKKAGTVLKQTHLVRFKIAFNISADDILKDQD